MISLLTFVMCEKLFIFVDYLRLISLERACRHKTHAYIYIYMAIHPYAGQDSQPLRVTALLMRWVRPEERMLTHLR